MNFRFLLIFFHLFVLSKYCWSWKLNRTLPTVRLSKSRFLSVKLNCIAQETFDLSNEILLSVEKTSPLPEGKDDKNVWLARMILISVSAFYGTNFGCVKILGDALDPSFAAFMRFGLASLLFFPYVVGVVKTNPKLIRGGLEVGIYNAIGYWAQSISLQTSHASTAAFICSLAVVVVPILDSLFDSQKSIDSLKKSLLPALLAAAGVASLELGGAQLPGVGDLWAFVQPVFFGLGFWRVERHMKNCSQPGEAQAFTGAMLLTVAISSLVWTTHDFVVPLLQEGGLPRLTSAFATQLIGLKDWHILAALGWTGIVTTALTAYGENIALRSLNASESTVIFSTEPIWGAAFASATLGETLGWNTFIGASLILSACVWSSLGSKIASLGFLTTAEVTTQADKLEEVTENVGTNWMELINKFQEGSSSGMLDS